MPEQIIIEDYNPDWPKMFEAERDNIFKALENRVSIEHIGSTAVPGLAAKPIIDIMIGLNHLEKAKKCIRPLEQIGYEYIPSYEIIIPERRYFCKSLFDKETFHLHMVEYGSDFWLRHI